MGNKILSGTRMTILLVLFAVLTSFFAYENLRETSDHILAVHGENVEDMATLLATNFQITDQEVEELKSITFNELSKNKTNERLVQMITGSDYHEPMVSVYVIATLAEGEVKYSTTEDNCDFWSVAPGTELNGIWLMNCAIENGKADYHEREDIYRYTYLSEKERKKYSSSKSNYEKSKDEWGTYISGYAPLYSTSGKFVGTLGLDISLDRYQRTVSGFQINLAAIMILMAGTLGALFMLYYQKYVVLKRREIYVDTLTGLQNRKYYEFLFPKKMKKVTKKAAFLAFIMIDVDNFKKVNDTYGHEEGDKCLAFIGHRIARVFHLPTDSCIRYGGDEFFLAAVTESEEEIQERCVQLQGMIQKVGDMTQDVFTISAGVYVIPGAEFNPQKVAEYVKKADQNLYHVKKHGKNQVCLTRGLR